MSPSKYMPTQTRSAKNPPISRRSLQIQTPGGFYSEIALKFTIKQSKNCTVTHKFLHLPKNYYVCQMIAVKKCNGILLLA